MTEVLSRRYVGEKVGRIRHGWGKYTYSGGSVYEGTWENGKKHGFGTLSFSDGSFIECNFVDGEIQVTFNAFRSYPTGSGSPKVGRW